MMMLRITLIALAGVMASGNAFALVVDLSNSGFYASDTALVQYNGAGGVTLTESEQSGVTFLSNDPYLGDPGFLVGADYTHLTFDYSFSTSGSDSFEFSLLDAAGGNDYANFFHDGTQAGAGNYAGSVVFDLASLGIIGSLIGLEFALTANALDTTFDAMLSIQNVEFVSSTVNPVPLPASIWMFASVVGAFLMRRRLNVKRR